MAVNQDDQHFLTLKVGTLFKSSNEEQRDCHYSVMLHSEAFSYDKYQITRVRSALPLGYKGNHQKKKDIFCGWFLMMSEML